MPDDLNGKSKSVLDDELTPKEREVLRAYRSPSRADIRRQVRLSVQYAIGSGIFACLGLSTNRPIYGFVVWAIFILWLVMRLRGAWRVAGLMPAIIEKYEARISALHAELKYRDSAGN